MGNVVGRTCGHSSEIYAFLADATVLLQPLREKAAADARDARNEVFWLLKTRQRQQALHYVEHAQEAEVVHDMIIAMQGYCDLMMREIADVGNQRVVSYKVKEARAGFHFLVTECEELSCLRDIDRALVMAAGLDPWFRCQVDPQIVTKLRRRTSQIAEESRERMLQEIARGRRLPPLPEAGACSPEIVESCKMCCSRAPPAPAG